MDTIPDVVNIILNYVCDTRAYSCVSKYAREQATARPDHAIWLKIRTPADHFVHGTTATVTWALANIPELVTLDQLGLTIALTNAIQADNVAAAAVLIPRVTDEYWLSSVARYCGPATYKLFDVDWTNIDLCDCRCVVEIGLDFEKVLHINDDILSSVVANDKLTDEYLCKMLPAGQLDPDDLDVWLLQLACETNRRDFALEIVRQYGTDRAAIMLGNIDNDTWIDRLRLTDELAMLSGCEYDRDSVRENAIAHGLVSELDPAGIERVHELEHQIISGTATLETINRCEGAMIDFIAKNCSDDILRTMLSDRDLKISLSDQLVTADRYGLVNPYYSDYNLVFSNTKTAEWATGERKYYRSTFIGKSIDAYILCDRLGGFRD